MNQEYGMAWTSVSSGALGHANEDLVAVFEQAGVADIVVLDGATSVAQRNYIDRHDGDVAWFVGRFGRAFGRTLAGRGSQEQAVRAAVDAVRAEFEDRTAGHAVPVHAWPVAAMTWVRVMPMGEASELMLYCLGDCKTLLLRADGSVLDLDPWSNPQEAVLQHAIAGLVDEGVDDPAARRERLLPMLRRRREEQNTAPQPQSLCLAPAGPFVARRYSLRAERGATLLVMTDGFYRLVDHYGLYTDAGLLRACAEGRLEGLLRELREYERASGGAGLAVKQADDASAVAWRF
jgi:hypothetical protein